MKKNSERDLDPSTHFDSELEFFNFAKPLRGRPELSSFSQAYPGKEWVKGCRTFFFLNIGSWCIAILRGVSKSTCSK